MVTEQDRHIEDERLWVAGVVAFETACGSAINDAMAAAADRALLAQIDRAHEAGWEWADIDDALRHVVFARRCGPTRARRSSPPRRGATGADLI